MEIIKPNEKYLLQYLEGCKATWENIPEKYIIHDPNKFNEWKDTIFQDFENAEKGINLPEGFIPNVTYWIIENDDYVGTLNLRLALNDHLAKYGGHYGIVIQPKYRKFGYGTKVMEFIFEEAKRRKINPFLTCTQETNIPAIKINEYYKPTRMEKDLITHNGNPLAIRRYYFNFDI